MLHKKEKFYIDFHGMHLRVDVLENEIQVHYQIHFFSRIVTVFMQVGSNGKPLWFEVGEGETNLAKQLGEIIIQL